jgi:phospho-N-acetylmuramoyl-pentapeptide-transferase
MSLLLGILIFSFAIHSLAIIPFINYLYRLKFYKKKSAILANKKDTASEHIRSKAKTPEGGGFLILVLVSLLFALIIPILKVAGVEITHVYPLNDEINVIFFTFITFGMLGLYDDIVGFFELDRELGYSGLRTSYKLIIQVVLALTIGTLLNVNLGIDIINVPFLGVVAFGHWFILLAAFLVVVFANSVNVTDGLDGLAGGLLMISLFGFLLLSASILDVPLSIFVALLLGGLISFLYFNVFPARIFMGDVGALAFGATFATVGLLTGKVFALLVIGLPFLINGLSSVVQIMGVKLLGKRLLPIAPVHYWLLKKGWSEPKIVQRAWLVNIMLVVVGLWLALS